MAGQPMRKELATASHFCSALPVFCTHQLCQKPLVALPSPPRRSVLPTPFLAPLSGRSARRKHLGLEDAFGLYNHDGKEENAQITHTFIYIDILFYIYIHTHIFIYIGS